MLHKNEQIKKTKSNQDIGFDDVCFIVSPIGKEGSENYDRFREILDYIIRPAIESSSMKLRVSLSWGRMT